MKIFRSSAEIGPDFGPSVVAIGNFDGVHAGHRQIMRRVVALAREKGYTPTILTFDPHPAQVLAPDRAPKLLMTIEQRVRAMESEGIEAVFLFPFSLDFAKLTPADFTSVVLWKILHARIILVGDDFRFGYKQSGDVHTLRTFGQTLGFELEAIAGVARHGIRISSSEIRTLVTEGAVSRACRLSPPSTSIP
jgi:riboflavin kinase/FMN adenylyltransferase